MLGGQKNEEKALSLQANLSEGTDYTSENSRQSRSGSLIGRQKLCLENKEASEGSYYEANDHFKRET